MPADSRYKAYADEMREKLAPFYIPFFEEKMIPPTSMFREFIG